MAKTRTLPPKMEPSSAAYQKEIQRLLRRMRDAANRARARGEDPVAAARRAAPDILALHGIAQRAVWSVLQRTNVAANSQFRDVADVKVKGTEVKVGHATYPMLQVRRAYHDLTHQETSNLTRLFARTTRRIAKGEPAYTPATAEGVAVRMTRGAHAAFEQARQEALGLKRYKWVSSRDERVRRRHRELDGTMQTWAQPPVAEADGRRYHPGRADNCRCTAVAVVDDVKALLDL